MGTIRWLAEKLSALLPSAILLFVSVAVAFALGEVAVRLLAPQQLILVRPDVWHGVDTLGWAKRPYLRTTINTGERTVNLATDSLGFRIPLDRAGEHERPRSERKRVLLIGDSMMEALQVEYERSLAGLLETRLSGAWNAPVEVWNTAVACWSPSHYLLLARSLLERTDFDHVVVSISLANDVTARSSDYFPRRTPTVIHRLRIPRRPSWREIRMSVLYPINDFLERRSHLYIALKNVSEVARTRFGLGGPDFPVEIRRSEVTSARWEVTADITRELAELAAEHGLTITFVLVPSPYQVDASLFAQIASAFKLDPEDVDLDQPNRLLGAAMRARGLSVVDPLPVMRAMHNEGEQLYGSVDRHLSPEGHRVLAELLAPIIERTANGSQEKRVALESPESDTVRPEPLH